jgi:hypothetical protein
LQAAQFIIKIYRTVILPLVLNRCKLLYLTLKQEHKLRVCENKAQKQTFELRKLKWRISELEASQLKNYQSDQIKDDVESDKMQHTCIAQNRDVNSNSVANREGKRPLRRPQGTWEDNIKWM